MPVRRRVAIAAGVAAVLAVGVVAGPPLRDRLSRRDDVPFKAVPAPPVSSQGGPGKYDNSGLKVHLDVPAAAHKDAVLEFTVRLTNEGDAAFHLDPCPAYMMNVGESATVTERSYLLNCGDAPSAIPAGGSVDFAMRLSLPGGASGPMSVTWRLGQVLSPRHPAATAEIHVSA